MSLIAMHCGVGVLLLMAAKADTGCSIAAERSLDTFDAASLLQAWKSHSSIDVGGRTDASRMQFVVTHYVDTDCTSASKEEQHQLFEVSAAPACYNIIGGEQRGASFQLHCPAQGPHVRQLLYGRPNCKGTVYSRKKMQLAFFSGACMNRHRVSPPLELPNASGCGSLLAATSITEKLVDMHVEAEDTNGTESAKSVRDANDVPAQPADATPVQQLATGGADTTAETGSTSASNESAQILRYINDVPKQPANGTQEGASVEDGTGERSAPSQSEGVPAVAPAHFEWAAEPAAPATEAETPATPEIAAGAPPHSEAAVLESTGADEHFRELAAANEYLEALDTVGAASGAASDTSAGTEEEHAPSRTVECDCSWTTRDSFACRGKTDGSDCFQVCCGGTEQEEHLNPARGKELATVVKGGRRMPASKAGSQTMVDTASIQAEKELAAEADRQLQWEYTRKVKGQVKEGDRKANATAAVDEDDSSVQWKADAGGEQSVEAEEDAVLQRALDIMKRRQTSKVAKARMTPAQRAAVVKKEHKRREQERKEEQRRAKEEEYWEEQQEKISEEVAVRRAQEDAERAKELQDRQVQLETNRTAEELEELKAKVEKVRQAKLEAEQAIARKQELKYKQEEKVSHLPDGSRVKIGTCQCAWAPVLGACQGANSDSSSHCHRVCCTTLEKALNMTDGGPDSLGDPTVQVEVAAQMRELAADMEKRAEQLLKEKRSMQRAQEMARAEQEKEAAETPVAINKTAEAVAQGKVIGRITLEADLRDGETANRSVVCECAWAREHGACDVLEGEDQCQKLCCAIDPEEEWPKNATAGNQTSDQCICDWIKEPSACLGPGDGSYCHGVCCTGEVIAQEEKAKKEQEERAVQLAKVQVTTPAPIFMKDGCDCEYAKAPDACSDTRTDSRNRCQRVCCWEALAKGEIGDE